MAVRPSDSSHFGRSPGKLVGCCNGQMIPSDELSDELNEVRAQAVLGVMATDKSRAIRDFWAFFVACVESNYIESNFRQPE